MVVGTNGAIAGAITVMNGARQVKGGGSGLPEWVFWIVVAAYAAAGIAMVGVFCYLVKEEIGYRREKRNRVWAPDNRYWQHGK
jgi:hypothetical protein